jgi:thiol-disulfide isomerase/thioredoxin
MSLYLKNIFKSIIIAASVSLPVSGYAATAADTRLEGLDGKQHALSEYLAKGKWTLVNIWGPTCPPCKEEIPELVLFHEEHMDKDAQVLGIAIDFPSFGYAKKQAVKKFFDDYLVDFPILLSDSTISRKLGAGMLEGLPTTYMYSPDGRLVAKQVGAITREIIENFINRYEARHRESAGGKIVD